MQIDVPDWLLTILDKVVLATVVGLVTSAIFLVISSRFRPKVDISPEIAEGKDTVSGETIYRIKIINRTRSPIVDIRAQLHVFKNHQTANGEIWKSHRLELNQASPLAIGKYDPSDRDANFAYRFVTYEDLQTLWDDDRAQFLRFRLYAKHSISGFGVFCSKDYRLKRNAIRPGEFSKGDTFEIA